MNKVAMPEFQSEAEEAQWWSDHQDEIADEFLDSNSSRDPERGATAREASAVGILIPYEDAALAMEYAQRKGIAFEEFATRIFHEALQEEVRKAG